MAVSGLLGWLNIRGLKLEVAVPDEIYRGLTTLVSLRLVNGKRFFPSFLLQVRIFGKTVAVNLINRGGAESASLLHVFAERGVQTVPFGEICSPFPINFFVRCRRAAVEERFLVFPAPHPCGSGGILDTALKSGELPTPFKGYEGDIARIADYTGSEPLKLIHWRLSAKHEAFKVKELTATAQEPVILDLDFLPGRNLEENLSCAAFLVNRLIRGNRPVGLKLRERVIPPALSREHRLRLLAELAAYGKD